MPTANANYVMHGCQTPQCKWIAWEVKQRKVIKVNELVMKTIPFVAQTSYCMCILPLHFFQTLHKTVQAWPTSLYNPQAVINAVDVSSFCWKTTSVYFHPFCLRTN